MVKNEKIITINRPVKEVFAYVSDLQTGSQWQTGLLEVRRITEGPTGVGTRYTSARKFLGKRLESGIEFTAYEPDKKLAFKSISGSSPFEESFVFESTPEGTRLTTVLELQTSGLMGLAEPLILSGVKRDMDSDFGNLKDLLENQATTI